MENIESSSDTEDFYEDGNKNKYKEKGKNKIYPIDGYNKNRNRLIKRNIKNGKRIYMENGNDSENNSEN